MYVLEELGLESEIVIAIAKEVAERQFAEYLDGKRGARLIGEYNRVFFKRDFAAPCHLIDPSLYDRNMHNEYINMIDTFRKELLKANRKKIKQSC